MKATSELYVSRFHRSFNDDQFFAQDMKNKNLTVRVNFDDDNTKASFILSLDETEKFIKQLQNSLESKG